MSSSGTSLTRRLVLGGALAVLAIVGGLACSILSTPRRGPGAADRGVAPEFSLPDANGRSVSLKGLLATGPAVLVFYRGHW